MARKSAGDCNDTTPRLDADSASRAWRRTMGFVAQHLGA
jgi:hypothetical protein